jgi:ribosomal protein L11 methyltransferase
MTPPLENEAWRLMVRVPILSRERFAAALESFADAVTFTEPDKSGLALIEAIANSPPNPGMVRASLALIAASAGIVEPELAIEKLPKRDWLADSKRAFAPFRIGRFSIHGSDFRGKPPAGCIGLAIDAGMAFGTGRHESTQGCLVAFQILARSRSFAQVLDLGCGCGTLSIAAAKLWRANVLACEIDPQAIPIAREAVHQNGLSNRVRVALADGPRRREPMRRGHFDLIAANILAPPLMGLSRDLKRALAPGGIIVLSGFLRPEAVMVERRYRALGIHLMNRIDLGGWRTLVLRR